MHRVSAPMLDHIKQVWEEWQKGESTIKNLDDYIKGYLVGKTTPKDEFEAAFDWIKIQIEVWEAGWEE